LPNPSFEEAVGPDVSGWKSWAWAGGADAQWSLDAPGRSGKQCLTIRSEKGADAAWTATVTVKPNTLYRLSGWIKTKDIQGAAGALFNIQNLQQVRTPRVTGTHDWTRVSTVFQSGEATVLEINCLFGGWGVSTGQAWYDDVALEPVAGDEPLTAAVTVGAAAEAKPYSRLIFGGFLEHFDRQVYGGVFEPGSPLSDTNGFRKDVIAALKELKVSTVRWPGGCYVSGYHWEPGVGKNRRPTDDMAWGVIEPNTFGTDEYVELSRLVGWQPYICNNAGDGTIEEMKNWVEYCNGAEGKYAQMRKDNGYAEPRNVRIWSIGNENYGDWEIGNKPIEQWAPLVLEAARKMKAADPGIQLTAAAANSKQWMLPLLKMTGEYLSYISIHEYWLPLWQKNDTPDYLTCIMLSDGPEESIARCIGVLEESGFRGRIKIAYDEWNLRAWHHPGFPRKTVQNYADPEVASLIAARAKADIASQYTMADALFSASFFNACLRHAYDVGMANIAPIVNTRGPLFVHPKGIVKRTHFHAMAMYANELEPRVGKLDITSDELHQGAKSIPVVDAVATVDDSGKNWAIALVNRHPEKDVSCTVQLEDRLLEGEHAALVLTGDSPDAFNDIEHPDRVVPRKTTLTFTQGEVSLPPHSLCIVKAPRRRPVAHRTARARLRDGGVGQAGADDVGRRRVTEERDCSITLSVGGRASSIPEECARRLGLGC
jgi:alpha-L-arabinofuranosidase